MESVAYGLARHRRGMAILIGLILLDLVTTAIGLFLVPHGVYEQNPVGVAAWALAGPLGLLAVKAAGMLPWMATLFLEGLDRDDPFVHRLVAFTLGGVAIFYTWIVAQNVLLLAHFA
jgi:hypothetical protein